MDFSYGDKVEYTQTDGNVVTGTIGAPVDDPTAVKIYRDDSPNEIGTWIGRQFVRHAN